MELSINEIKKNFSKVIQLLIEGKENTIIVTKNGTPVAEFKPINNSRFKRIGAAKKEMAGFDLSLEDFDSINVKEFGL